MISEAPIGLLARPGVATLVTVAAFAASSNFRWGVPWVWHFVAAGAFFALVLSLGHWGRRRAALQDAKWIQRLPLDVVLPERDRGGAVVFDLIFPALTAPSIETLTELIRGARLARRFAPLHVDSRLIIFRHLRSRWLVRRDLRALINRIALPLSLTHGLQRVAGRSFSVPLRPSPTTSTAIAE